MKPHLRSILAVAVIATGLSATTPARSETNLTPGAPGPSIGHETVHGRWMILLKDDLPSRTVAPQHHAAQRSAALARRAAVDPQRLRPVSPTLHLLTLPAELSKAQASALLSSIRRDPDVVAVEPDQPVQQHSATPNDPGFSDHQYQSAQPVGQWYLKANAGEVRSAINAQGAWPYSQGDNAIVIAVLDTGVLFDHPDLRRANAGGRLLPGYDFVSADIGGSFMRANDGDGWDADPSDPGDWIDDTLLADNPTALSGCSVGKSSWHGTRTSALVGSLSQNGVGIAGVDWRARLLPVRVLGRCGGYTSNIVAGLRWAAGLPIADVPDNPTPAKIINLSLGHVGGCSQIEQATIDELTARGIVVVASAGNNQGAVESPGNCRGVIAVGGLRHVGTKVGFSSFGAEVAISAPGGNCVNIGAQQPCLYSIDTATNAGSAEPAENTYTTQLKNNVGTSFAAPLVAGVAGLLLAVNNTLTPAQVRAAIQGSASPFPVDPGLPTCPVVANGESDIGQCNCTTTQCGAGMLNAQAAVSLVNPAECFFNWAERSVPYLFPSGPTSHVTDAYHYRHYPQFNSYLALTGDSGRVVYLGSQGLSDLGSRTQWFKDAGCQ